MAYDGKYETPAELLLDKSTSHDEKLEMLNQWRKDERALIRASGEGMHSNDRPNKLKEVEKALATLQESTSDK